MVNTAENKILKAIKNSIQFCETLNIPITLKANETECPKVNAVIKANIFDQFSIGCEITRTETKSI